MPAQSDDGLYRGMPLALLKKIDRLGSRESAHSVSAGLLRRLPKKTESFRLNPLMVARAVSLAVAKLLLGGPVRNFV